MKAGVNVTSSSVTSIRYWNIIRETTWRNTQYFIDFESSIDVKLTSLNRCYRSGVDLPFKVDEILKTCWSGTPILNQWRGQTSRKKMDEMPENRRNKRIQSKFQRAQFKANSEEGEFEQILLERMEGQNNFFKYTKFMWEHLILMQSMTQAFLMMGQIINQSMSLNLLPSHYQPSSFGSSMPSSFSWASNLQRNPDLRNSSYT